MNKIALYLSILILFGVSIYLIFDEPEKIIIQKIEKSKIIENKNSQKEDVKIEYMITQKSKLNSDINELNINNTQISNQTSNLESTKEIKLTQKQQEAKKRYEINQQALNYQMQYQQITKTPNTHQEFLQMREKYIKEANYQLNNMPEIEQRIAYQNIEQKNKMQMMMINKNENEK